MKNKKFYYEKAKLTEENRKLINDYASKQEMKLLMYCLDVKSFDLSEFKKNTSSNFLLLKDMFNNYQLMKAYNVSEKTIYNWTKVSKLLTKNY